MISDTDVGEQPGYHILPIYAPFDVFLSAFFEVVNHFTPMIRFLIPPLAAKHFLIHQ